jgi:hypothetical protein
MTSIQALHKSAHNLVKVFGRKRNVGAEADVENPRVYGEEFVELGIELRVVVLEDRAYCCQEWRQLFGDFKTEEGIDKHEIIGGLERSQRILDTSGGSHFPGPIVPGYECRYGLDNNKFVAEAR